MEALKDKYGRNLRSETPMRSQLEMVITFSYAVSKVTSKGESNCYDQPMWRSVETCKAVTISVHKALSQ